MIRSAEQGREADESSKQEDAESGDVEEIPKQSLRDLNASCNNIEPLKSFVYFAVQYMFQDFVFESLNYSLLFLESLFSHKFTASVQFLAETSWNLDISVGRKSGRACFLLENV